MRRASRVSRARLPIFETCSSLLIAAACLAPLGCRGQDWILGGGAEGEGGGASRFDYGDVVLVDELSSDEDQDDASLTTDRLLVFFSSTREGGAGREDVWMASRASVDEEFGEPVPVAGVNSEERETAAAISGDGLTLWFASDRADGEDMDVYSSSRVSRDEEFGTVVPHPELSSDDDDLPRAPTADDSILPLAVHSDETSYDIYFAELGADGSVATLVAATSLNTEHSEVDPALSADGLFLVFSSDRDDDDGDLYFAERADRAAEFSEPEPLAELNTEDEEADPWLSADGSILYFTSRRNGPSEIFRAERGAE